MIPSWPQAAVPQGALILAPESGHIIAAQINGHAVRLRVDPGYEGIVLNRDVAERSGWSAPFGRMTCWSGRCGWRGRPASRR
jgi:predicted aspartyl protease